MHTDHSVHYPFFQKRSYFYISSIPTIMSSSSASAVAADLDFEHDTIEDEDTINAAEFVLPPMISLSSYLQFGVSFNRSIFEGWVKQPSPCCAAAAVAGAWNSLLRLNRKNVLARSHSDVLEVL